jgi:hypothetical protein
MALNIGVVEQICVRSESSVLTFSCTRAHNTYRNWSIYHSLLSAYKNLFSDIRHSQNAKYLEMFEFVTSRKTVIV